MGIVPSYTAVASVTTRALGGGSLEWMQRVKALKCPEKGVLQITLLANDSVDSLRPMFWCSIQGLGLGSFCKNLSKLSIHTFAGGTNNRSRCRWEPRIRSAIGKVLV